MTVVSLIGILYMVIALVGFVLVGLYLMAGHFVAKIRRNIEGRRAVKVRLMKLNR